MPPVSRFFPVFSLFPLLAQANAGAEPGVSAGTYLQTLLALGLIVGILAGTAWLARRVTGGQGFGKGGMRVVGGVALGPKERIVLIEVGEQWLVIGIVPGQIRTLHRLPKGVLPGDEAALTATPFSRRLKQMMERRHGD